MFLIFVTSVAFLLWRYFNRYKNSLEKLGIPIDKTIHWMMHKTDFTGHDVKCMKKYGRIWASYAGPLPEIVVGEPEIIKEIMVKHFDSFSNRSYFGVEDQHMSLIDAGDEKWPVIRKALSPTFTSGKLKGMTGEMDKVVENLMSHLEKKIKSDGPVLNVKPLFQCLSLDTIANCAFGIDTNSFERPDNVLFQRCIRAFTDLQLKDMSENVMAHLLKLFPVLFGYIDAYGKENYGYLRDTTKDIVYARKEKRGDFIDRLKELNDGLGKGTHNDKVLTENLIMAQGIGFFIAGFETSSNTMSTLCYNLAMNPDVQDKIVEEISQVLEEHNGRIDHETIGHMPYLEAAVDENLRLCPPVTRLDRTCNKTCQVGNMTITEGMTTVFPIWAMHHNPDFFPQPELFQPERFFKEAKNEIPQYAYIPFGGGPRMCIGMRFAMVEMKIALAKLLSKYRIVKAPETRLDFTTGDAFFLSYPEVKVKLEARS